MSKNVMLRRTATVSVAALLLLGLFCVASFADVVTQSYGGRDMLVHAPAKLAPQGQRGLVVVLHGGLGNASRIANAQFESGMNLNDVADKYGFVVAYLNGTNIARMMPGTMLGWNAGGCCGQPATINVDDVGYITGAVKDLEQRYGIAPNHAFVMGHSNGAMMALRMMCETHVFAAAVSISGALETDDATCPAASGMHILAIHGVDDANVPVAGGVGPRGLSHVNFRSEDYTSGVFRKSGAQYDLDLVPGADHKLDNLQTAVEKTDGMSIADKAARFFGLEK